MSSRFDTEETIKYKKELAKGAAPNWRAGNNPLDTDQIFKKIVAAKKGRANINRTGNNTHQLLVDAGKREDYSLYCRDLIVKCKAKYYN